MRTCSEITASSLCAPAPWGSLKPGRSSAEAGLTLMDLWESWASAYNHPEVGEQNVVSSNITVYLLQDGCKRSSRYEHLSTGGLLLVAFPPMARRLKTRITQESETGRAPKQHIKHKRPTAPHFWYPPSIDPWNQNVRSFCL